MILDRGVFLILFLLFFAPFSSKAQLPFEAGVAGGVNTTQISGDDLSGFHQFGIAGGLFVSRGISEDMDLELQMLYSQKGSRKTPNPEEGDFTSYNLRVNYIDMPILLRYRLEGFEFFGGPLVGARVGSVTEEDQNGSIPDAGRPAFKPYDIGVHLGLDYRLTEAFTMDLRFSNSFLPARDHTGGSTNAQNTGRYLNRGQYHTMVTFLVKYRILGERGVD